MAYWELEKMDYWELEKIFEITKGKRIRKKEKAFCVLVAPIIKRYGRNNYEIYVEGVFNNHIEEWGVFTTDPYQPNLILKSKFHSKFNSDIFWFLFKQLRAILTRQLVSIRWNFNIKKINKTKISVPVDYSGIWDWKEITHFVKTDPNIRMFKSTWQEKTLFLLRSLETIVNSDFQPSFRVVDQYSTINSKNKLNIFLIKQLQLKLENWKTQYGIDCFQYTTLTFLGTSFYRIDINLSHGKFQERIITGGDCSYPIIADFDFEIDYTTKQIQTIINQIKGDKPHLNSSDYYDIFRQIKLGSKIKEWEIIDTIGEQFFRDHKFNYLTALDLKKTDYWLFENQAPVTDLRFEDLKNNLSVIVKFANEFDEKTIEQLAILADLEQQYRPDNKIIVICCDSSNRKMQTWIKIKNDDGKNFDEIERFYRIDQFNPMQYYLDLTLNKIWKKVELNKFFEIHYVESPKSSQYWKHFIEMIIIENYDPHNKILNYKTFDYETLMANFNTIDFLNDRWAFGIFTKNNNKQICLAFLEPLAVSYNDSFKHFNQKDFNKESFIFLWHNLNKIINQDTIGNSIKLIYMKDWDVGEYLLWSKIFLPIDYENNCPDWKQISQQSVWQWINEN